MIEWDAPFVKKAPSRVAPPPAAILLRRATYSSSVSICDTLTHPCGIFFIYSNAYGPYKTKNKKFNSGVLTLLRINREQGFDCSLVMLIYGFASLHSISLTDRSGLHDNVHSPYWCRAIMVTESREE